MSNYFNNPLPGVPLIESPFFDDIFAEAALDDATKKIATDLRTQGWAVIDFPEPEFDAIAERIKQSLHSRYDWDSWTSEGWKKNDGLRIQDAYQYNKDVQKLAANPKVIALLSALYGRRAWPFQTLNFPVGTQQHFHTDSVYFNSVPERFMCGVWVALEDIGPNQGPLLYYPGSHKWPIYTNEHIGISAAQNDTAGQSSFHTLWEELVRVNHAQPTQFHAKKGQALIWMANLLHGGSRQTDPGLTRWSQVTHYYFDGCSYFAPLHSDPFHGKILFRKPVDIRTGAVMRDMYSGKTVPERFIRYMDANRRFASRGRRLYWRLMDRLTKPGQV